MSVLTIVSALPDHSWSTNFKGVDKAALYRRVSLFMFCLISTRHEENGVF